MNFGRKQVVSCVFALLTLGCATDRKEYWLDESYESARYLETACVAPVQPALFANNRAAAKAGGVNAGGTAGGLALVSSPNPVRDAEIGRAHV